MTTRRTDRRRVLHVAHQVLPHVGGLEAVVAAETRGLAARGWQVSVVGSAGRGPAAPGRRTEDGVSVTRVRAWNGLEERFGVPFPVFSPRLVPVLAREVRRADVVHVHDVLYVSSWVAALCCLLLRTPYVVHRHVGFVHHSSPLVRLVQAVVLATWGRLVLAGARAVLPIDEHVAASLDGSLGDPTKVEVLGNGVDTELYRPAVERPPGQWRGARPRVLFVGRFVPKKGFDVVAAAAGDEYDLVFAGGERPAGFEDPRLHFLGAVPAARMPEVYRSADAMVIASVGECPLTVLEAMSSGLPVLLREDPALHSAWTAGPGVWFVDMEGGELREALRALVADPEEMRRIGAAGRAHVVGAFSWQAHLDHLETTYRRVQGERR